MSERPQGSEETEAEKLEWRSPDEAPITLSGFPWYATDGVFRRLPLDSAEPLPPSVHTLAGNTAGGQLRFQTKRFVTVLTMIVMMKLMKVN